MKNDKAKYIGSYGTKYENYYTQEWEYRGQKYEVEVPKNPWKCSSEYERGGYMSQYNQHKRAQEAIDESIDNPLEEISEPKKGLWTKEYENMIWNMMFGE